MGCVRVWTDRQINHTNRQALNACLSVCLAVCPSSAQLSATRCTALSYLTRGAECSPLTGADAWWCGVVWCGVVCIVRTQAYMYMSALMYHMRTWKRKEEEGASNTPMKHNTAEHSRCTIFHYTELHTIYKVLMLVLCPPSGLRGQLSSPHRLGPVHHSIKWLKIELKTNQKQPGEKSTHDRKETKVETQDVVALAAVVGDGVVVPFSSLLPSINYLCSLSLSLSLSVSVSLSRGVCVCVYVCPRHLPGQEVSSNL